MIALCHNCGTTKAAPSQRCHLCGRVPVSDDELALAFMLTDQFLPGERLAEASRLIKSGRRIELPPHVRTAVLAAIQSARTEQARAQGGPAIGPRGWGIVAVIAAMLFLLFNSWPHYQWASLRDTVPSYMTFVNRFPSSDYTNAASERIRVLREPEVWSEAKEADQIEALRGYARNYPNGRYLYDAKARMTELADAQWALIASTDSRNEVLKFLQEYPETSKTSAAEARIVTIADEQWRRMSASRSVPAIKKFLEDYPETSMRAMAEQRIQTLYDDWSWVREQDSLEHYQRFVARNPRHPQRSWIEKRIIDLEVREIAAGEYGEMPRAQPLRLGGSTVEVQVSNQTGYELTVMYSGPDSKKIVIPSGGTRTVSLPPGDYKVAASVTAANVRNYYGTDTMRGGNYSSRFYIQTGFGGFPTRTYGPGRR